MNTGIFARTSCYRAVSKLQPLALLEKDPAHEGSKDGSNH